MMKTENHQNERNTYQTRVAEKRKQLFIFSDRTYMFLMGISLFRFIANVQKCFQHLKAYKTTVKQIPNIKSIKQLNPPEWLFKLLKT